MGSFFNDLRFGARALLKRPGSTVLSIVAFGLGIGLCSTMFSIIYGVYGRGLGLPNEDRVRIIFRTNPSENITRMGVPQHDFYDWRDQQQSFVGLAGYSEGTINVSGNEGPERFDGAFVTANLFDVLGIAPVLGSGLREGDDAPGAPLTALISYDVWAQRYRGDSSVVGSTIRVNGEQATILGVMPPGVYFPQEEDIWIPRRDERAANPQRGSGPWITVVGRLRDDVTIEQAQGDMSTIAQRLAQEYPESNEGVGVTLTTFVEQVVGGEVATVLTAMQVATFLVLLIACSNVANLLLARAALRTKEAAVRSALGASRVRVAMPFFAEAILLSGAGAALGVALTYFGTDLFDRATTGVGRPYFIQFPVDLPILGFVLIVTAITALVSGAAPAYQIVRADVNLILKDEGRGSSSFRAGRISRALVVAEVAMSCALLVGAGLMAKSIIKLSTFEFPFETESIFTARVALFDTDYPTVESRNRFFDDVKLRLEALPAAQSVAFTSALPGSNSGGTRRIGLEGETYATDQDYPSAHVATITPDFFNTFDVEVARGRDFSQQDDADALDVAIVNHAFVERFYAGQDPIGRRFREGDSRNQGDWKTVVGVVPNMKMEGFDPDAGNGSGYYLPVAQTDTRFLSLSIRVRNSEPLTIAPEVRAAVRGVNPDMPIYWVRDIPEVVHQGTWFYSVFGSLFIVFGVAALFLASVGLYGVLAFSVSRRLQEMGIRMALGAGGRNVLGLVLREGAIQLSIGLALGVGAALGVSNILGIVMYDVQPRDPVVFGTTVVVILTVGLLASVIPARRATRVSPMVALRYD